MDVTMYKELKIKGLRGFGTEQTLNLAVPVDDKEGSGLTIIVGANNSGKSTIWEAFRALSGQQDVSFTEGQRNKNANHQIKISISDTMMRFQHCKLGLLVVVKPQKQVALLNVSLCLPEEPLVLLLENTVKSVKIPTFSLICSCHHNAEGETTSFQYDYLNQIVIKQRKNYLTRK